MTGCEPSCGICCAPLTTLTTGVIQVGGCGVGEVEIGGAERIGGMGDTGDNDATE